jgi:hypothetical protein
MPALNINFTEEEMNELRNATAEGGTSMKNFVHDAALAEAHRAKVARAAAKIGRISLGLAKRLAEE